jgi:hypothetical protein
MQVPTLTKLAGSDKYAAWTAAAIGYLAMVAALTVAWLV